MSEARVDIVGDDKVSVAIRSANRSLASLESAAQSAQHAVSGLIGAFAVGFLVNQTKHALEFADSIGAMAKSVSLTTKAFQELEFAQRQSDGTAEGFNQGMLRFTQTIGDAANGSKQAQDALIRIGITMDDLKKKSVETLFVQGTDNLAKFGDEATRNSAIQDVFGKQALQTANAFAIQRTEMDELRVAAQQSGAVLDEVTIKNAKKAKDEMEALSRVISVQLTQAFVNAGPLLVKGAKLLADLAEMAGWAARRIGLLSDVTLEQQYQSLLEKRLDLTERIAAIQASGFDTATTRSLIAELQAGLPPIDRQIKDMQARLGATKRDVAGPANRPAVSGEIKAPPGVHNAQEDDSENRYERLRGSLDKEFAAKTEHDDRLRELALAYQTGQITSDTEFKMLGEEIERQHQERLAQIQREGLSALAQQQDAANRSRSAMWQAAWAGDVASVGGVMHEMAGLMTSGSQRMFKIGKMAALSEAAISMFLSVQNALATKPFFPVGLAMASTATLLGIANIQKIRATEFGGSPSTPTFSASPGTGLPVGSSSPIAPPTSPETSTGSAPTVIINGFIGTRDFLDNVVAPWFADAFNNRDVVLIDRTSRQAAVLAP